MFRLAGAIIAAGVLWVGCAAPPEAPVIQQDDVVLFLGPDLRPESLQFPEYLLMEDFELEAHGRVPETNLIGIGLKTKLDLQSARSRCDTMLNSKAWRVGTVEEGAQSFRLLATRKGETLEIRGVQGSGLTQVFILYRPRSASFGPNG